MNTLGLWTVNSEINNRICTTKQSNFFMFIIKNLFEQFNKLPNIYFGIVLILQCIPQVSITDGVPTMAIPLGSIILISMIKDQYEDQTRSEQDDLENNLKTTIVDEHQSSIIKWQDVVQGNIILVKQDEPIPADILLLHSSEKGGVAQIETKSLDGETNLKNKNPCKHTHSAMLDVISNSGKDIMSDLSMINDGLKVCDGSLKQEQPNESLKQFSGSINLGGERHNLDSDNLVLRGCVLKNTRQILGKVLQVGHSSKIMLNSTNTRFKMSKLIRILNVNVIYIFLFVNFISVTLALVGSIRVINEDIQLDQGDLVEFEMSSIVTRQGGWCLSTAQLVPISLLVTIDIVDLVLMKMMEVDVSLYSREFESPFKVNTYNLSEQLGQVTHIFTDKTGTLTKNEMKFKSVYAMTDTYQGLLNEEDQYDMEQMLENDCCQFQDENFRDDLESSNYLQKLVKAFVLNHETVIDSQNNFSQSSSDEESFIKFAGAFGYQFMYSDKHKIIINVQGIDIEQEILQVFPFESERGRQSIVLKQNDTIFLQIKGADSQMLTHSANKINVEEEYDITKESNMLLKVLNEQSDQGLRTLVFGMKQITQSEWMIFKNKQNELYGDVDQLNELKAIIMNLESDFEIIGCTAIEDKLQDEVGLVLKQFRDTGVRIAMITGDKQQTAIKIGISCNLIQDNRHIWYLDGKSILTDVSNEAKEMESGIQKVLVLNGQDQDKITYEWENTQLLMKLVDICDVVVATRMSPKQKSMLVTSFKETHPGSMTLSIGDGANDVSMINSADVGIGVKGKEGRQATRASDFVIGEFKLLRRLCFSQGVENQRKMAMTIVYQFAKNAAFVCLQWQSGIFTTFDHGIFLDAFSMEVYNMLYTAILIIMQVWFDRAGDQDELEFDMDWQWLGMKGSFFNNFILLFNMFFACLVSCIFCTLSWQGIQTIPFLNQGQFQSQSMFTVLTVYTNLALQTRFQSHGWPTIITCFVSIASIPVFQPMSWLFLSSSKYHLSTFNQMVYFGSYQSIFYQLLLIEVVFIAVFLEAYQFGPIFTGSAHGKENKMFSVVQRRDTVKPLDEKKTTNQSKFQKTSLTQTFSYRESLFADMDQSYIRTAIVNHVSNFKSKFINNYTSQEDLNNNISNRNNSIASPTNKEKI